MSDRRISAGDLAIAARFLRAVPGFLRSPLDLGTARQALARRLVFDLDFIRGCALDTLLFLDARGLGPRWRHADWEVPGGASIFRLLELASFGRPARWFTHVDTADRGLHTRYRWSARLLRAMGALCRAPFPRPQHVPVERPRPIVDWMREVLDEGEVP